MTMKKAMTVLGPVDADRLGHILPHEHILVDLSDLDIAPKYPELLDKKVSIEILGKLRRDIWSCRDNLRLDDQQLAGQEIASFKRNGGGTIVDVTPVGLKRDVNPIREIAKQTGVNIVVGTGYYHAAVHPRQVAELSVGDIAGWMVKELQVGIDDTGIKAGIIGEIGIESPMHPEEEKVLRAAARAQRRSGAPISVHQHGGNEIKQIDAILSQEGISPERVILCHMGSASQELRFWAADRGYYVEIDRFGHEYYTDALAGIITRDPDRIKMVKALIERGHLRQLLISNDIALKMLLKRYGGWSYEHIKLNIKPFMLREGIPIKAVDTMIYYNPMRAIVYLD
jgi:phosphotriesterase-related protein